MFSFNYVSAFGVFFCSFCITFISMPYFINFLHKISIGQSINIYIESIGDHAKKNKTPPMGGLLILFASILSFFIFFGQHIDKSIYLVLFIGISFGLIGFCDDYKKVTSNKHLGVLIKIRFGLEILLSAFVIFLMQKFNTDVSFSKYLVFQKHSMNIGILYFILRVFAISGSANGLNMTDGLDGLAAFPLILSYLFFAIFGVLVSQKGGFHSYPQFINGKIVSGLCLSVCGSVLAFLWFNAKPAKIFMGDTGSLGLGGMLGTIAVLLKGEILLVIIGMLFVIETMSSGLQIGYYKLTKKRLFSIAPFHHSLEKRGIPEITIVIRLWIFSIICFIIGLTILNTPF